MKPELTDAQWLHEHAEVSIEELADLSGLPPELLRELVGYGALVPVDTHASQWTFTSECVVSVRTVNRLREDFDLDANALSVALNLIERIHGLEAQLRELRTQFPHVKLKR
jgi:chaperone modulatory protein CbpM